MRPVLIGSRAAKIHFPDFREPRDWDWFGKREDLVPSNPAELVEAFWHPYLEAHDWSEDIANPTELYTIKVSHAFWANRWPKHIRDIEFYQSKGVTLDKNLFDLLYLVWTEHYGRKRARLRAGDTAETFFTATVKRKYDHDSLHASVAYYDEPLFNRILRDGEAVAVDKAKFDALPFDVKCQLVREEVYATALERKIIPSNYTETPLRSYRWALEQTVTSYSKGWFPLWIVENIHAGDLTKPDVDYVQRHHDNSHRLIVLEK